MQLRAARSLWTNFFWAKYSIPLATCSPKPIRSLTVGFCGRPRDVKQRSCPCSRLERSQIYTLFSKRIKCRTSPCFMYGSTTRGSPSLGSMMPSRDRIFGWSKPFMMRPSLRKWSTSFRSVIPVKRQKYIDIPQPKVSFLFLFKKTNVRTVQ